MAGVPHRILQLSLGVLLSATIFVVAAEVLTRQLDVLDRLNGFPRRLYLATTAPDLPYRLRPGVHVRVRDVDVRVNALGLRGAEATPTPALGRRRVLVLGDSVVYGDGLDVADTFAVLLEEALRDGGATSIEVLNGAAPGYDTPAELAYLRDVGLALDPDALVLGVSLNDYTPAPGLTPWGFLTVKPEERSRMPWLGNHSEFYTLARWIIVYARGGHWYQRAAAAAPAGPAAPPSPQGWAALDRGIAVMHKRFYAAPAPATWDRVRHALAGIRDLAKAHDLPLLVVIFPERDQIESAPPNLDPQRRWLELCQELALRCLDLVPAFAAAASEGALFQDTQHPNATGMRVAARATAAVLRP
jgi:lysophospholipase L1-like esterase